MKKFVSLLMTIILINISLPAAADVQSFGAFKFNVYEKSVSITGFNSVFTKKLVIPSEVNGLPVTAVNAAVDRENSARWIDVEEIVFPLGVEFVGSEVGASFPNLSDVTLPDTLKKIGSYAFSGTKLTEVSLPASLEEIGSFAFSETDIERIEIPKNTKKFDNSILYGSKGNEIELAAHSKYFEKIDGGIYNKEENALIKYTGSQNTYETPSFVKKVSSFAFCGNTSLQEVILGENVSAVGRGAFENTKIQKTVIEGSLEEIPPCLFYNCEKLEYVKLPPSITKIDENAFASCPSLCEVVMEGDIKYIAKNAFDEKMSGTVYLSRSGIAPAYFEEKENVTLELGSAGAAANLPLALFGERDGKIYIDRFLGGQEDVVIPAYISGKQVSGISDWAFSALELGSLTVHAPKMQIGCGAFCGSSLKRLELTGNGEGVGIGARAFEGAALESARLDNAVKSIGEKSFANTLLTEITIPKGVQKIDEMAFAFCPYLERVCFEGDAPFIAENAFYGSENVKIYYKNGAKGFEEILLNTPKEKVPSLMQDGEHINMKTFPVNIEGTVMLPLKEIFEIYGYSVKWSGSEGEHGTVTLESGIDSIKLFIGSTYAEKNGVGINICAAPVILSGVTRLPSRALADLLGFKILWNGTYNTVELNS